MSESNRDLVKQIVSAALDVPTDEREALIVERCGEDAALLAEVRDMLAAMESVERREFLTLAPPPTHSSTRSIHTNISEQPGTMIGGRYKLREMIGEGGFGTVYVAEQLSPIKRRVALKIIKAGMDTRQVVARFEAERQALAMMDHPNIAKVLDAGQTETGRPFFVMELVRGVPITQFCDDAKLSTRQRVELLSTVCQAVQHAHQKGVIHRDLKPQNVLVTLHDGKPVPKVIDFGIAKATTASLTDKTIYTEFRQMIGTPAYMSPEQAEMSGLDIDTRSDIYSLGVLLYELLTGSTPFETTRLMRAGLGEIQRIIKEEDPPLPSVKLSTLGGRLPTIAATRSVEPKGLGKLLAGELDWIVMRAMEKDRGRRYATASDLATDLARHLTGEPVVAAPPSWNYRARKFVRKYRAPVAAGAGATALLLAGAAATTMMWLRAERESGEKLIALEGQRRATTQATARADENARLFDQAEQRNYISNIATANTAINIGDYVGARQALDLCPPSHRAIEWKLTNAIARGPSFTVPDCNYIVYSSDSRRAVLWNSGSGRYLFVDLLRGTTTPSLVAAATISQPEFSPDSRYLITSIGRSRGTVEVLDAGTGKAVASIEASGHACEIHYRANGELHMQIDSELRRFTTDGKPIGEPLRFPSLESVQFGDRNDWALGAKGVKQFAVHQPMTPSPTFHELPGDYSSAWINSLADAALLTDSHSQESTLCSLAPDGTLKLIALPSNGSARFTDDGKNVVVGRSGKIEVLDTSGHLVRTIPVDPMFGTPTFQLDHTSRAIQIRGEHSSQTQIVDFTTGRSITPVLPSDYAGEFSTDGKRWTYTDESAVVHCVNLDTGTIDRLPLPVDPVIRGLTYLGYMDSEYHTSPDHRFVAMPGAGGEMRIFDWQTFTGSPRFTTGWTEQQIALTSSDSLRLGRFRNGAERQLFVSDINSGIELGPVGSADITYLDVAAFGHHRSDNRLTLALARGTGGVEIVDPIRGRTLNVYETGAPVRWIVYDEAGDRYVACTQRGDVWTITVNGAVAEARFTLAAVSAMAVSADGKRAAFGHDDGRITVRAIDASDTRIVTLPARSAAQITSLCFDANGRQLFSGSDDGGLREWAIDSAAAATVTREFDGYNQPVSAITLDASGERLITGGVDRTLRVWDRPSGRLIMLTRLPVAPLAIQLNAGDASLLTLCNDYVLVWDSSTVRQAQAERLIEGERTFATQLVTDRLAGPTPTEQLLASFRADASLTMPQRLEAIHVAGPIIELLNASATARAFELGKRSFTTPRVIAAAREVKDLSPRDYTDLQHAAERYKPDITLFNGQGGWDIIADPAGPPDRMQSLIDTADELFQTKDPNVAYYDVFSAIMYRAGRYQQAIKLADEFLASTFATDTSDAWKAKRVHLIRYMAMFKLGDVARARSELVTFLFGQSDDPYDWITNKISDEAVAMMSPLMEPRGEQPATTQATTQATTEPAKPATVTAVSPTTAKPALMPTSIPTTEPTSRSAAPDHASASTTAPVR